MKHTHKIYAVKAFLNNGRYDGSNRTKEAYVSDLKLWMEYLRKAYRLEWYQAKEDHCLAWVKAMRGHELSDSTVGRRIACLRQFYQFHVYKKTIRVDPTIALKYIKLAPKMKTNRGLDEGQREKLLAAFRWDTPHQRTASMFTMIGIYTGLRRNEIRLMRWEEVDIEAAKITTIGKGNKKAEVDIPGPLLKKFKEYQKKSGYLFPGREGGPVTMGACGNYVPEVAGWAGIKRINAHDLRHSLCNWLIDKGVPIEVTQEAMRHSNIATTMTYYHLKDDKKKKELVRVLG